jgi:7-cyano-7-deazaguanine synthase
VLLSGGIDSAVALAWAYQQKQELYGISFRYYLRPFRERLAVYRLLQSYPAKLIEVPLPFLKEAADAQAQIPNIPEGYIPNRNMIFYSTACYFAELHGCSNIIGGHTGEDQDAFSDTSPGFFDRLQQLMNEALLAGKVRIELPLVQMTKVEVLRKALEWNVPLQNTWSCYWDGKTPCGECISCRERTAAFHHLGVTDPLASDG